MLIMKLIIVILTLCLLSFSVNARPLIASPFTSFNGDRYGANIVSEAPHKTMNLARGALREVRRAAGRPRAWCGWWLGQHLGMTNRHLWLARNWASVGSNAGGPKVGAIVVWKHHVGIITGHAGSGWVVKSGNDGHAVRERVRSVSGAIAFRIPS